MFTTTTTKKGFFLHLHKHMVCYHPTNTWYMRHRKIRGEVKTYHMLKGSGMLSKTHVLLCPASWIHGRQKGNREQNSLIYHQRKP